MEHQHGQHGAHAHQQHHNNRHDHHHGRTAHGHGASLNSVAFIGDRALPDRLLDRGKSSAW